MNFILKHYAIIVATMACGTAILLTPSRKVESKPQFINVSDCNCRITGVVREGSSSGAGIPGVSVTVKGTATGTVTDHDGAFTLCVDGYPSGVIKYTLVGYGAREQPFSCVCGYGKTQNIIMVEDTKGDDELRSDTSEDSSS